MGDRPDLVSVRSSVLVVILHGNDLYTLNLGDSRAVLTTYDEPNDINGEKDLKAYKLTDSHTLENEIEKTRIIQEQRTTYISCDGKGNGNGERQIEGHPCLIKRVRLTLFHFY
ncbi:hypothetical protein SAY86_027983 [Trapa natans]|uniref:PPM-type phosphatase domain-containing protein n=1 Tax=Trapa natans TaxID=22666 RepID=A0AAN7M098_TRANT|nr:hypothetical protein SAY86_027983 [Trapa natans]